MRTVADIMERAIVATPDLDIPSLARLLADAHADGAVVVHESTIVGVATSMDLVARWKALHGPSILHVLDLVLPLPRSAADREDDRRVMATTVGDLMTRDPVTVRPDALASDAATRMANDHLSLLPVVDADGALVGAVTRRSILLAMAHGPR